MSERNFKGNHEVLWAFEYCCCIYESSYATVSIHRTQEGAKRAMMEHKEAQLAESKYNKDKRWIVNPITVKE